MFLNACHLLESSLMYSISLQKRLFHSVSLSCFSFHHEYKSLQSWRHFGTFSWVFSKLWQVSEHYILISLLSSLASFSSHCQLKFSSKFPPGFCTSEFPGCLSKVQAKQWKFSIFLSFLLLFPGFVQRASSLLQLFGSPFISPSVTKLYRTWELGIWKTICSCTFLARNLGHREKLAH